MNEPTELQKAVETPRTEAAKFIIYDEYEQIVDVVDPEFARGLELELLSAAKQLSALHALSDLHRDEFIRIRAIATDTEIQGLCDRAVTQIEQHVPLIVQRDSAVRQYLALQAENEELKRDMQIILAELSGAYEGLMLHPSTVDSSGFCISTLSKEKLKVIQEIISRYGQL